LAGAAISAVEGAAAAPRGIGAAGAVLRGSRICAAGASTILRAATILCGSARAILSAATILRGSARTATVLRTPARLSARAICLITSPGSAGLICSTTIDIVHATGLLIARQVLTTGIGLTAVLLSRLCRLRLIAAVLLC
jgi:hypothetical protein